VVINVAIVTNLIRVFLLEQGWIHIVEIYERMMKDGWRRCGDYVYIPNLDK
jgi:arginyl-tRNA--protein-N-Asp/Glu arginylyltransferase